MSIDAGIYDVFGKTITIKKNRDMAVIIYESRVKMCVNTSDDIVDTISDIFHFKEFTIGENKNDVSGVTFNIIRIDKDKYRISFDYDNIKISFSTLNLNSIKNKVILTQLL